jgi:hypothetical protein
MAFALGLIVLEAISVSGHAALAPRIVPMPQSLKAVTLPKPVGINAYVKNEAAAIALGKALFWDMQAGSDGTVACATCHYQAGADGRSVNQLNPGANGAFDIARPNHKLVASDFPFRKLSDVTDRTSTVVRDRDDVAGSQGVHGAMFNNIVLGGRKDNAALVAADPMGYQVGGLNVRRVTGRNTPSVINASGTAVRAGCSTVAIRSACRTRALATSRWTTSANSCRRVSRSIWPAPLRRRSVRRSRMSRCPRAVAPS